MGNRFAYRTRSAGTFKYDISGLIRSRAVISNSSMPFTEREKIYFYGLYCSLMDFIKESQMIHLEYKEKGNINDEGKSCIGVLLKHLYGRAISTGNLYNLETNRFARAALENAYLFLDDDMMMNKLNETNVLKTIITNEGKHSLCIYTFRIFCLLGYPRPLVFFVKTTNRKRNSKDKLFYLRKSAGWGR